MNEVMENYFERVIIIITSKQGVARQLMVWKLRHKVATF